MEDRYTYFLFGQEACLILDEHDADKVLDSDVHYETYEWDEQNNYPADILLAYQGWGDYSIITKEEYEKLKL